MNFGFQPHRSRATRALCLVLALLSACANMLWAVAQYDCLSTPFGIPRKVIVKKDRAVVYANADFTGGDQALKYFRKYFIFEESEKGYKIGEATVRGSILGWVKREDVLPWNTDQAIFLVNKQATGRVPARIWPDKKDVGRGDVPCFEEDLATRHTTEPFPIPG